MEKGFFFALFKQGIVNFNAFLNSPLKKPGIN